MAGKPSILNEAKSAKAEELSREDYLIKAFLAGPSGAGKTTTALTLPGKKLLIDVDHRAESIFGFEDVEVLPCWSLDPSSAKGWEKLTKVKDELWALVHSNNFPYSLILLDGLTSMNRVAMNWSLLLNPKTGLGGAPAEQHYVPQMHVLANFILGMLPLPCHVVLTGHMEFHEDRKYNTLEWAPRMYGKTRNEICAWFNESYYCEKRKDKPAEDGTQRQRFIWNTMGTGRKEMFKSSMNHLGKYWDDPIEVTLPKDWTGSPEDAPQGFTKLLDMRFGEGGQR